MKNDLPSSDQKLFPVQAMIEGGCRGGFSSGELVAFLYARGFPKEQWSDRVDEAFRGMEGLSP